MTAGHHFNVSILVDPESEDGSYLNLLCILVLKDLGVFVVIPGELVFPDNVEVLQGYSFTRRLLMRNGGISSHLLLFSIEIVQD